jgi:hypothetical protein
VNEDLWGDVVLAAMCGFILWAWAGMPVPDPVRHLLTGVEPPEDEG